ncbi:hypothetical protein TNCV_2630241 [Trichonephila clavipes]|uniref:Uncharacterized protein n=1 Tax=Trichonephila clavipes TaxID=2585209 RepID=A0A8X6SJM3_TRICX|nr:hypothetical protein TNCV_2630241 [Trichonephila clavipes]
MAYPISCQVNMMSSEQSSPINQGARTTLPFEYDLAGHLSKTCLQSRGEETFYTTLLALSSLRRETSIRYIVYCWNVFLNFLKYLKEFKFFMAYPISCQVNMMSSGAI